MSALTNQFISDAYIGQLHTGSLSLSSSGVTPIYDGLGAKSALSLGLSGSGAAIYGSLTANNVIYPAANSIITLIDLLYPIGSIQFTTNDINPSIRFVGTTWTRISQGRFIAGVGTGVDKNNNQKTYGVGNDTNGEYSHALGADEIPSHYHYVAVDQPSVDNGVPSLSPDTYMAVSRNPAGIGTFEYRLDGLAQVANVGRTSDVVRSTAVSATPLTNPAYGLYVWSRTV